MMYAVDSRREGPEIKVLHDKIRKCRRAHARSCSWCHDPILKGDSYIDVAFIEDGVFKHEMYHSYHRYGDG